MFHVYYDDGAGNSGVMDVEAADLEDAIAYLEANGYQFEGAVEYEFQID